MVTPEDKEFEDDILGSGYHIAVPFQIEKKSSGEIRIIAYSFAVGHAREFEEKYGDDPFTPEALGFIEEKIDPIMHEMDFDTSHAAERIFLEYRTETVNTDVILPECELISSLDGEKYEEELELDCFELDETNRIDRMAVMRDGEGKIVCYAGLDDICENDGLLEVTVECSPEYRNRGYAKSCVALLTEYLLSAGEKVKYVCEEDNVYSVRTALSSGYSLYKKVLPYVCYKEGRDGSEEDDECEDCECGHDHDHEHEHGDK